MNPENTPIPPLQPQQVHVWRFSLQADPSALAACARLLSADENQRAARFAKLEHRRRFTVARANLRQLLASYTCRPPEALRFTYGPTGKPALSFEGWTFNVSHSDELALIAVALEDKNQGTDAGVGVDLERIQPLDYEAVARRVLEEPDLALLNRSPASAKEDLFFRLWVRHEARAKAIGATVGTRADLPVYDLDVGPEYRAALATAIEEVRIELLER